MPSLAPLGSTILDTGKTSEEWVAVLKERGIEVSERTLREKANKLGAFHNLGRQMIITPMQLDEIFERSQPCNSKPISGEKPTGLAVVLSTMGHQSPATTGAARAYLQKAKQGGGATPKKHGRSVVTSLEKRRRS